MSDAYIDYINGELEGIREAGGIAFEFPVHPIQETLKRGQASSLANSLRPRGIHTCLFLLTYYKNSNYYLLLSMISNRTARAAALGKNR